MKDFKKSGFCVVSTLNIIHILIQIDKNR